MGYKEFARERDAKMVEIISTNKAKVLRFCCGELIGYSFDNKIKVTTVPLAIQDAQGAAVVGAVARLEIAELWIDREHALLNFQCVGSAYWYDEEPEWWSGRGKKIAI